MQSMQSSILFEVYGMRHNLLLIKMPSKGKFIHHAIFLEAISNLKI